MNRMPNITLSMPKEDQERLREIANKERRSISQQVIFMMDFYIRYFGKDMDDLIGSGYYPSPDKKKD